MRPFELTVGDSFKYSTAYFANTIFRPSQRQSQSEKMVVYHRNTFTSTVKRVFDVCLSGILILSVLSWLTLIVALANRLLGRMGTFYAQKRIGMDGVPFSCYKFKTMRDRGAADVLPDDDPGDRVNSFSRWLRHTGLDELPQLVNVWKGQMSLIGPRPYMEQETFELLAYRADFRFRYRVKPGISGWAQIQGCKGPMRSMTEIDRRLDLDLEYVRRWNIRMDLYIFAVSIWQAAWAVIGRQVIMERIQLRQRTEATAALSLDK